MIVRCASPKQWLPDSKKPLDALFELSTGDKRQGEERGKQPLLSVWNRDVLTVGEIKAAIGRDEIMIFKLNVRDIHAIKVKDSMIPVEVHKDPIENQLHGEAHGGIQGLHRTPGNTKADYKYLRKQLCDLCVLEDES